MGLVKRKAAHIEYAQAVPLKYTIDGDACIYVQKGKCGACIKFCESDAIDFDQKKKIETLNVGAVVLAPGFEPFDPSEFDSYNYSKHKNVVTSMEMERILSASGPTTGHLIRMSDKKEPKKIIKVPKVVKKIAANPTRLKMIKIVKANISIISFPVHLGVS